MELPLGISSVSGQATRQIQRQWPGWTFPAYPGANPDGGVERVPVIRGITGIDEGSTFSWVTIDDGSLRGEARSATLPLPQVILEKVQAGEALGPVMSQHTGIDEIGRKEGAIGVFTAGKLTRSSVYHQAVVLALSPFHNAIYR